MKGNDDLQLYPAWCVWARYYVNGPWESCDFTMSYTRTRAISKIDALYTKPGEYRRQRRRGLMKCIRTVALPADRVL